MTADDARERRIAHLIDRIMETALVEGLGMECKPGEILIALNKARTHVRQIQAVKHDGATGAARYREFLGWLRAK